MYFPLFLVVTWVVILTPHSQNTWPVSSQGRLPLLVGLMFCPTIIRADSIHSLGMPESGTDTAIQSPLGLGETRYLVSPPSPLASGFFSTRLRLYHCVPK